MIAEIIGMENNRLLVDADYGFGKWEIKWHTVVGIASTNHFQVILTEGDTYYGSLATQQDGLILIIPEDTDTSSITVTYPEIVLLRPVDKQAISRLSGSLGFGLSQSRARSLITFNIRGEIGYTTKKSLIDLSYNALLSSQDETEPISRTEGILSYKFLISKKYFISVSSSGLSNTEQNLDLRWNMQAGMGEFLITNQKLFWNILAGANHNLERALNESSGRSSWEGLFQTELDIFNLGDLKLNTKALVFAGITEGGRWRTDFKFDIKYDIKYLKKTNLNNKIFVKLGISANYDNRPAENAKELDFVISTTLGISWND